MPIRKIEKPHLTALPLVLLEVSIAKFQSLARNRKQQDRATSHAAAGAFPIIPVYRKLERIDNLRLSTVGKVLFGRRKTRD
jgi:hypothetical protein